MTTRFTAAELKRFRAFLNAAIDREEQGPSSDANALKQQHWDELRTHLGVNGMSTGLQHLDQLVEDIVQGKSNVSLQGPVVVLPAAPGVPSAAPAAALSTKSSAKKPATSSKKTSKRKASADDTVTKSSAKKPRSTKKLTASTLPSYDFAKLLEVNPSAPRVVRTAIAIVLHKAEEAGKTPWRLAYPWSGRPLCSLAVLDDSPACFLGVGVPRPSRIKLSSILSPQAEDASHSLARLSFTSLCIETWGFYAFLEKLEKRPEMSWLGGQPGKSPRGGRQPQGPIAEDLAVLHDKDQARYEATLENALNPAKVDAYGYPQVLSFLEFTKALNPKAIAKNRLSMTALARIRQDLTSKTKLKTSNNGVKQRQLDVMAQMADRTYELPSVNPPTQKELDREDWSDFEDAGNYDD
ncbi:hypothetical protein PPTG_18720 [Phytophthora nicotianae INRA-310]|uniref:Uncharacterized protein n=1 Tax=Phytophthora nicotianae (strain INRA-310) TaxID=761204 RepID=W2PGW1_PHYN3|nr:hypothetical protein PPTG_18720 [Phytophthora nicotianae INRA-310]ETM99468.1 hypothetical protein PPTG_18720 [Phytophthora nicotianae INRA-310]